MNLFGLNVGIQGWEKYCLRQSLTAAALFLGLNAAALAIDDAIVVPDATTRLTPYTSTTDNLPHNVKLGPMDISLIAGLRTTYSDNINLAHDKQPKTRAEVPTEVLIPAFIVSELKTAFQIGFLIFLPFLIIDLIVSSTLMSMGMIMLPPTFISLPFKVLLFVLVDGWDLVIRSLVQSFH